MAAIFIKSCSNRVDCICSNCKNKKQKLELNKYKVQNVQMAVPQILTQLSTKEWKSTMQLVEELNINHTVICKALNWLITNEPKLLVDKQAAGKDFRLVRVFSLSK